MPPFLITCVLQFEALSTSRRLGLHLSSNSVDGENTYQGKELYILFVGCFGQWHEVPGVCGNDMFHLIWWTTGSQQALCWTVWWCCQVCIMLPMTDINLNADNNCNIIRLEQLCMHPHAVIVWAFRSSDWRNCSSTSLLYLEISLVVRMALRLLLMQYFMCFYLATSSC